MELPLWSPQEELRGMTVKIPWFYRHRHVEFLAHTPPKTKKTPSFFQMVGDPKMVVTVREIPPKMPKTFRFRQNIIIAILSPGDSSRGLFIPDRWRSPITFEFGSRKLTIPKRSPALAESPGRWLLKPWLLSWNSEHSEKPGPPKWMVYFMENPY